MIGPRRLWLVVLGVLGLALAVPATAAPAWVTLPNPGLDVHDAAVGPDGTTVYAGLLTGSPTKYAVQIRPPGGPLGAVITLSDTSAVGAPALGVSPSGTFAVAWIDAGTVKVATMDAGAAAFAPGVTVPAGAGSAGGIPAVAVDAQGTTTVLWTTSEALPALVTRIRLQAAARPAGGAFTAPQQLDAIDANLSLGQIANIIGLQADVGDGGAAIAGWLVSSQLTTPFLSTTVTARVALRPSGPGGVFGAPQVIQSAMQSFAPGMPNASLRGVAIAMGRDGNAAVAWGFSSQDTIIFPPPPPVETVSLRVGTANGGLAPGVDPVGTLIGQSPSDPALAFAPDGRLMVAWLGAALGKRRVMSAVRAPVGTYSAVQMVDPAPDATTPLAPVATWAPAATPTITWPIVAAGIGAIYSASGGTDGAMGEATEVAEGITGVTGLVAARRAAGDLVLSWRGVVASVAGSFSRVFDASGPVLRDIVVPSPGRARQAGAFAVTAVDAWSPVASTGWTFGDGASAPTGAATHTYARKGTYQAAVTATDDLGNASSLTVPVQVQPGTAPVIRSAGQSPSRWRRGPALPRRVSSARVRAGTVFAVNVNVASSLRFAFMREVPGRRVGGRCVAPRPSNRTARACVRRVALGAATFPAVAGRNRVAFAGRINRSRRLAPGRYLVEITAADADGVRSRARQLRFTILP